MQRRLQTAGLTLIELLIVIAILSILVSLLLPVLARAREAGREIVCTSNLRQIGMALQMYIEDYGYRPKELHQMIGGRYSDPSILVCPSDPTGDYERLHEPKECTGCLYPISYTYHGRWDDMEWGPIAALAPNAGIVVCRLHGERVGDFHLNFTDATALEGKILRLRMDGAVVRRHIYWRRQKEPIGRAIYYEPIRLYIENP